MKLRFPRLTYANVVATLALFAALGGGAWAATRLPKHSVGARQLKRNAVVTPKIKNEAVTAAKIRKGTIDGSRLDLNSIGTVPSARTATTAANANNATNANDAGKLGGADPSAYLGRVAQATANQLNLHLSASAVANATPGGGALAISVPTGVGFVVADADASFADAAPTPSTMEVWVQEDEECAAKGFGWENESFGGLDTASSRQTVSQHLAFPVGPGTHTFRLCLQVASATDVFSRTLSVATVARGASG